MAAGDLGADRSGPECALVPGQQVAGEAEPQRQEQQEHAAHPVQLARRLEGAHDEDPQHVGDAHHDHAVGGPVVDGADRSAEAHLAFDILDAGVSCFGGGLVVEGQHDAGDRLDDEQEGGDAAQAVQPAQGVFGHRLAQDLFESGSETS